MKNQRRDFLKKASGSLALATIGAGITTSAAAKSIQLRSQIKTSANDKIRIGLIQMSAMLHP